MTKWEWIEFIGLGLLLGSVLGVCIFMLVVV